jgi:choline dehydrogenase-like flavoprotein
MHQTPQENELTDNSILTKHGIDVTVNSPSVGEHLNDQITAEQAYVVNQNFTGAGGFIGYFNADDVWGDSVANYSQSVKNSFPDWAKKTSAASGGVVSEKTLMKLFEIQHQLIFKDKVAISEVIVNAPSGGAGLIDYWGLMPFSRGSIHITSANVSQAAAINPNFFMLDYDVQQEIGTAKMARKVAESAPLNALLTSETSPSLELVPEAATDAQWAGWLKANYRSNFHYIATAAMMSEDMGGVVDSNHLVYGTANVRVVDASVLPFQVSGHLTSTLYALAERVAEIMKEEACN